MRESVRRRRRRNPHSWACTWHCSCTFRPCSACTSPRTVPLLSIPPSRCCCMFRFVQGSGSHRILKRISLRCCPPGIQLIQLLLFLLFRSDCSRTRTHSYSCKHTTAGRFRLGNLRSSLPRVCTCAPARWSTGGRCSRNSCRFPRNGKQYRPCCQACRWPSAAHCHLSQHTLSTHQCISPLQAQRCKSTSFSP